HARDGGRHDTTALESLDHLAPIEMALGDGVARPRVGGDYRVAMLESRQRLRIALYHIAVELDHRLLLRLGPNTLAVEKTSESDLDQQGPPCQSQDEHDRGHQPISQWQQPPRQRTPQVGRVTHRSFDSHAVR